MNPRLTDALLLSVLVVLAAWVALSGQQMPDWVASSFGLGGQVQGWMSRKSYVAVALGLQLGVPGLLLLLAQMLRHTPDSLINLPNKAYWLAPARRASTLACLGRHLRWMVLLLGVFMAALHALLMEAQRSQPPALPAHSMQTLLLLFLASTGAWVVSLWWHFRSAR